jgi:hypothetical protein
MQTDTDPAIARACPKVDLPAWKRPHSVKRILRRLGSPDRLQEGRPSNGRDPAKRVGMGTGDNARLLQAGVMRKGGMA